MDNWKPYTWAEVEALRKVYQRDCRYLRIDDKDIESANPHFEAAMEWCNRPNPWGDQ